MRTNNAEPVSDGSLVHAALQGDRRAAHAIVHRYVPLVRRCLGSSFTGVDLDDHVQEVFVRCFASLTRLRDPDALRSYLIGIALRWAASERRRCRIRWWEKLTATGELPERTGQWDASIEMREVAWRTRALLEGLKPETSRVLELRLVHEQEMTDVAQTMGVSLATAKRHLARSVVRIRALAQGEPAVAEYVRDSGWSRRPLRDAARAGAHADFPSNGPCQK